MIHLDFILFLLLAAALGYGMLRFIKYLAAHQATRKARARSDEDSDQTPPSPGSGHPDKGHPAQDSR